MLNGHVTHLRNYDPRTSLELEDRPYLLLTNTTLNDSGTYRCIIRSYYMSTTFDINVTIAGKVYASNYFVSFSEFVLVNFLILLYKYNLK